MRPIDFRALDRIPPPPLLNAVLEARVPLEIAATAACWPILSALPRGDGHPVLALPGFMGDDSSTLLLRSFLRGRGYRPQGWGLGRNLGPTPEVVRGLRERLREVRERSGQRAVSLIGQSLGGVYARELGRRFPGSVRQVITLAAPARDLFATRVFRSARPQRARSDFRTAPQLARRLTRPLRVPSTSVYSKTDGVVNWRSCLLDKAPRSENVRVESSHVGMAFSALAFYVIANRLAQAEDSWTPFAWPPLFRYLEENGD